MGADTTGFVRTQAKATCALGKPGTVGSRPHAAMDLGSDNHLVTARELLQRTPDNLLRVAV